jgi:general secretion pathway protein L
MSTLIVTLNAPGTSSNELAYCLASNAQTISSHGSAPLALLPKADDAVLLLPSSTLSWHKVSLPKLSRSISAQKMRAILDGLIEEQLLDDTALLHIAHLRPATKASKVGSSPDWLAVCDKGWLTRHLNAIRDAGHRVSRIVPEAFPLPARNKMADDYTHHIHISGMPEAAMVTIAQASGVLCAPLAHAHAIWPALDAEDFARITAEPAVAEAAEAVLDTKVTIMQSAQHALHAMLDAQIHGVDLAQGDLIVAGRGRWLQQAGAVLRNLASTPAWRPARIGLGVLILAHIVGLNAWAWKERSALDTKRSQATQLLTQTFPNVKVVVDAPVQMQRELTALRRASGVVGSRDLESMYARFSLLANINTAPVAIDFAAGEVSIKGSGLGATQLSELQPKLQSAGLAARSEADRIIISEAASARAGGAK